MFLARGVKRARSPKDLVGTSATRAATGLRSVRYAKEVPGVKTVLANDLEKDAAAACARNAAENGASDKVEAHCGDAVAYMINHRTSGQFDVIDLDPYLRRAGFFLRRASRPRDDGRDDADLPRRIAATPRPGRRIVRGDAATPRPRRG